MPDIKPSPTATALDPADPRVSELESLVARFIAVYEQMLGLVRRRHAAMRGARTNEIAECIARESDAIQQIAELEKQRLRLVGSLAQDLGSPSKQYTRLSWLAERAPESCRARMTEQAQRLRGLIEEVHRENQLVGTAARALALHMEGLMQQLAARLNHAQTYTRRGSVTPGNTVVSALDLTS